MINFFSCEQCTHCICSKGNVCPYENSGDENSGDENDMVGEEACRVAVSQETLDLYEFVDIDF